MKLIHHARDLAPGDRKVCVAIGMFDGVHLGHQHVIQQTITDARTHNGLAVALTFDRHPNSVVAPGKTPPLIYSLVHKLRVIGALGVDAILLIHFDRAFSEQSGESFVRGLARDFGRIHSICVGSDFTFGHRRSGNVDLLEKFGLELGFKVHALAAVSVDDAVVSSTRIREAIRGGALDAAGQMLGRPYSVSGVVMAGEQLGQKIGFPTANLDISGLILPPTGVYAGYATLNNQTHRAVANLGYRPTLQQPQPQLRCEVHLLDHDSELYGREIEFTFVERLREELKFPSLEALKTQIQKDVATARTLLTRVRKGN